MTKRDFVALLRWESRFEICSSLPPSAVFENLRRQTVLSRSWRRLNRFTSDCPFVGTLSENGGTLRIRDFYPSIAVGRQIDFRLGLGVDGSGAKFDGVLRLRGALLAYEVCGLVAMFALQLWMVYLGISAGGHFGFRGVVQIGQEFLLIAFIWIYVRLGLWFSRKKEAKMLRLIEDALEAPITVRFPTAPGVPPASVRVPGGTFVRPR